MSSQLSDADKIKHRALSAQADQALRSGIKMSDAERNWLTEGADWERRMHRVFKGITTRRQRRQALERAEARLNA